VDTHRASTEEVKEFLRVAFYQLFGLSPEQGFVEFRPDGGAIWVVLARASSTSREVCAKQTVYSHLQYHNSKEPGINDRQ
jgi:hypothetical protein